MPAIDQWLTGDVTNPTDYLCRVLRIPNDISLVMAVNGALLMLTRDFLWKEFGSETPQQAAELMSVMFDAYLASGLDCENMSHFNLQVITASGNYIPSAGLVNALVFTIGGGGGGGGCGATANTGGGGGGGGGCSVRLFQAATIGVSQVVTIGGGGAGGVGNLPGTNGVNTTFGALATGGLGNGGSAGGAVGGVAVGGGNGGASANADFVITADGGEPGEGPIGGSGGRSFLGGSAVAKTVAGNGNAGRNYGGGGGGAQSSGVAVNGGAGAPGAVIVLELIAD